MSVSVSSAAPRDAAPLLRASHALMESLFPKEANHYLSIEALEAPEVRFFVAEHGGARVGCAALKVFEEYGEVKSMFVDPEARGLGVGAALLARLTEEGRALGLPVIRLETGTKLEAAHRLYRRHGFVDCGAFGDYEDGAPYSLYMEYVL